MRPPNSKESAPARARAVQTRNPGSSTLTARSSTVKSTTKTSGHVKSISITKGLPLSPSATTSTREKETSDTLITSTENRAIDPGHGARAAGRQKTAKAIRLVWESLESHLDAAAGAELASKCCNEMIGRPPFHRKCVREYAYIIEVLTNHL